jgi:hypothetical protein
LTTESNNPQIEPRSLHGTFPPPPAALHDPTTSGPAKPHADRADVLEQIRKLGELRDAGLLTADKFEALKIDLLSRLWR